MRRSPERTGHLAVNLACQKEPLEESVKPQGICYWCYELHNTQRGSPRQLQEGYEMFESEVTKQSSKPQSQTLRPEGQSGSPPESVNPVGKSWHPNV